MPIRDVALLIIWLGLIPVSLVRPWIGILGWYWIAYFVPHGLVWSFARTLPVAQAIGGATLAGWLFTKDRKPLPRCGITFFMLVFVAHITLTTIVAHNRENSFGKWVWVVKVLLMTFVMMTLFQDRVRLRWLYLVAALGLGFYGFKGGIWVLSTGGGELVLGPDQSFFADNNTLGLALCMNLPLLLYLSREETRPWLKSFMRLVFGLSIIAIIFTYSRGAFLGLLTVLAVLIWRSPWRLRFGVIILLVALIGAPLAPERLWTRLGSISEQDSAETRDRSAAGRIEAWQTAVSIAITYPLTGAGFRALDNPELWLIHFGPDYIATSDAHSLYFELLEEHGFLGIAIYFAAVFSALGTLRHLRKRWHEDPEHGYLSHYAEMIQLSFTAFLVSGAFLTVAYFDLYYLLLGTAAVLHQLGRVAEANVTATSAVRSVSLVRAETLPSPQRPRHA